MRCRSCACGTEWRASAAVVLLCLQSVLPCWCFTRWDSGRGCVEGGAGSTATRVRTCSGVLSGGRSAESCAGVPFQMLTDVGHAITKIPDGFEAHRQIKKVYSARADMVSGMESLVDWAMAEALAFGTLIAEGNHVRLSGQVRP